MRKIIISLMLTLTAFIANAQPVLSWKKLTGYKST